MINHWNIESTLSKTPGTLSAYHLCDGEIITKVQLREWVWASNNFDSLLYQRGLHPYHHGYRGQAWISGDEQIEAIARYVEAVNDKRINPMDILCLRYPKDWRTFRQHLNAALACPKSPSR